MNSSLSSLSSDIHHSLKQAAWATAGAWLREDGVHTEQYRHRLLTALEQALHLYFDMVIALYEADLVQYSPQSLDAVCRIRGRIQRALSGLRNAVPAREGFARLVETTQYFHDLSQIVVPDMQRWLRQHHKARELQRAIRRALQWPLLAHDLPLARN